jgi:3-oxoacyl-[acyl-carrier-protein] synthase-3
MLMKAKIIGTGSCTPKRVVKNSDLARIVDTNDEWIMARTGIRERRIADTGESTTMLATEAARRALKASGLKASDIDLVITGTVTPDMNFPSTSCFLQMELGLKAGIPAMDVSAACSGFLYAIDIAEKFIATGKAKHALVVGVDVFSKIVDWSDRGTCILFGDGAGAVVLSATKGKGGILASRLYSDGRKWEMLYAKRGVIKTPFDKKSKVKAKGRDRESFVRMKGNEIFKLAVRSMNGALAEVLKEAKLNASDISLLIPHQANKRILKAMQARLKLSDEQVFSNIESYGNTSAASIPLALDEAVQACRVKRGDIVLFVAFGGGLTWAATVIKW